jgi:hypothetical protein
MWSTNEFYIPKGMRSEEQSFKNLRKPNCFGTIARF